MGRVLYADSAAGLEANDLRGFFAGWPDPPSPETRLEMLGGSDHVVLTLDDGTPSALLPSSPAAS